MRIEKSEKFRYYVVKSQNGIRFIKVFLKLQNGEWQSFFLAKRIIDPETGRYKVYIISYPSIQFYPSDSNPLSFPSFSKALSFLKSLT